MSERKVIYLRIGRETVSNVEKYICHDADNPSRFPDPPAATRALTDTIIISLTLMGLSDACGGAGQPEAFVPS